MGKSKQRCFRKCKPYSSKIMTREETIKKIVKLFSDNNFDKNVKDMISLFGITAEELSEAGATFEELKALNFQ